MPSEGPADLRDAEIGGPHLRIGRAGVGAEPALHVSRERGREGFVHIARFDLGLHDVSLGGDLLGRERRSVVRLQLCDGFRIASLSETELGARHLEAGCQYRLVHDHHRHGGPGYAVDEDVGAGLAHRRGGCVGGGDLDVLLERQPFILRRETRQRVLDHAVLENRLVVRNHADADELAFRVDGYEQVRRRPRVAGDGGEIDRFEYIPYEVVRLRDVVFEKRPDRQIGIALADVERLREILGQRRLVEFPGVRRRRSQRHEEEGKQQRGQG